ncbi:MAG: AAA family ATPase, partial [Gemmatimonadetes bacterium]|nr:AAA family ATPase [Gemmatimonadota bacterium]
EPRQPQTGDALQKEPAATTGERPRGRTELNVSPGMARWLASFAVLLVLAYGGWRLYLSLREPDLPAVTYSHLLAEIDAGHVQSIVVRPGADVRGTWQRAGADAERAPEFTVAYPVQTVDALAQRAQAHGVTITLAPAPDGSQVQRLVGLALEVLVLVGIGFFLFRQMRGGQSGDLGQDGKSDTTFDDVAGTQGAVDDLREMVDFLRRPQAFRALGAQIPKGALLVGPPGTGKTLLARAVAGEAGVPFFSVSGSEVTGFLVGMGAHRIKTLFRKARKKGGVIFIDEIDALGGKRGRNRSHNEDDRTLNQLLVEMDGFDPLHGVVVIAATNRPDDLDEALKRPGRFDRTISVSPPTSSGREEILRLHATRRGVPLADDVDLGRIARLTPGSSGAELANLLNEAAIAAAREGDAQVRWAHVEHARDRMLLGKERKGFRALDRERCTVAYHEAGHALAGVVCAPEDGLHKVTIQARGQALGVAFFSPEDDRFLYRRNYLEGVIMKGLAGRAAEELVFGAHAVTSGAQSDLQQVNGIAKRMVYQLGMGPQTGLLIHDGEPGSLSGEAHAEMDREVRAILERLYQQTVDLLACNREPLAALAVALLERETIDGVEAVEIMEEAGLSRPAALLPAGVADEREALAAG